MRLPDDVIIARPKLTHYLLVLRAKNDKSKYLAQAGFSLEQPDALEAAIRRLVASFDAFEDGFDQYSRYYRVEGTLVGPDGTLPVVTIWLFGLEDQTFRFVTLKPKKA